MKTQTRFAPLKTFIRFMVSAVSNASLYSPEHAQVKRLVDRAILSLDAALDEADDITLMVVVDELIFHGQRLGSDMYLNRFVQFLRNRGIGNIRFIRGATHEELLTLITTLSLPRDRRQEIRSSDNIRVGKVEALLAEGEDGEDSDWVRQLPFSDLGRHETKKLTDVYESVRKKQKLSVVGLRDIVGNFVDSFEKEADAFLAVAAIRTVDEYTFTHSTNVCVLNLAQAMALGIERQLLHDIGIAGMLHDVGKLYIPEEVITKDGELTDEEWELMRSHPVRGAQHLLDTPGVPRLAVAVAFEHHMGFNLEGYPKVSKSWKLNLCSQMTTISDLFDALRTRRTYREPMEAERIALIIKSKSGVDLHPLLTKNFLNVLRRFTDTPDSS